MTEEAVCPYCAGEPVDTGTIHPWGAPIFAGCPACGCSKAGSLTPLLPQVIRCPRCRSEDVKWTPAPDQRAFEDSIGPTGGIPSYWRGPCRMSPPDDAGVRHFLVVRKPEKPPSYWPAELHCPRCSSENAAAAAAAQRLFHLNP